MTTFGYFLAGEECQPDRLVEQAKVDAGYDEVYVSQIGPRYKEFFEAYGDQVLPRLRSHTESQGG